jgi:hypothetical protein
MWLLLTHGEHRGICLPVIRCKTNKIDTLPLNIDRKVFFKIICTVRIYKNSHRYLFQCSFDRKLKRSQFYIVHVSSIRRFSLCNTQIKIQNESVLEICIY